MKEPKQKRCPICREMFTPRSWYGRRKTRCCSNAGCVRDYAERARDLEFKQETTKMRKESNEKSLSWWAKQVQDKCNEFIRLRDDGQPCISCGNTNPNIKYDAGHYISVGASKFLRYEPTNIHLQCSSSCNVHKSSNAIKYRKALVKKYGAEHVEWLEFDHPTPRRRIDDYKQLYEFFKSEIKKLKANYER